MSEETPAKLPFVSRLKHLGVGGVLGLLIGGAGAGKVWMDGTAAVDEAEAAAQTAKADANKAIADVKSELDEATKRENVLRARWYLSRAMNDLEAANFGLVNQHLAAAARELDGMEEYKTIRATVLATKITDFSSLEAPRAVLRGLMRQVDTAIGT